MTRSDTVCLRLLLLVVVAACGRERRPRGRHASTTAQTVVDDLPTTWRYVAGIVTRTHDDSLVTLGVRLTLRGQHPMQPADETVARILVGLQHYVHTASRTPQELIAQQARHGGVLAGSGGSALGGRLTAFAPTFSDDPRYTVVDVSVPWITRGNHVRLTPELCITPHQRFATVRGAPGIYACTPTRLGRAVEAPE